MNKMVPNTSNSNLGKLSKHDAQKLCSVASDIHLADRSRCEAIIKIGEARVCYRSVTDALTTCLDRHSSKELQLEALNTVFAIYNANPDNFNSNRWQPVIAQIRLLIKHGCEEVSNVANGIYSSISTVLTNTPGSNCSSEIDLNQELLSPAQIPSKVPTLIEQLEQSHSYMRPNKIMRELLLLCLSGDRFALEEVTRVQYQGRSPEVQFWASRILAASQVPPEHYIMKSIELLRTLPSQTFKEDCHFYGRRTAKILYNNDSLVDSITERWPVSEWPVAFKKAFINFLFHKHPEEIPEKLVDIIREIGNNGSNCNLEAIMIINGLSK